MLHSAENLSAFLSAIIVASMWIALLGAAVIQFFMPYIVKWYQRRALSVWARRTNRIVRRSGGSGKPTWSRDLAWLLELVPARSGQKNHFLQRVNELIDDGFKRLDLPDSIPPFIFYRGTESLLSAHRIMGLSDEQFLGRIRTETRSSLARPSHNVPLFLLATAGMKLEQEVIPLIVMEMIIELHPDVARKIGEAPSTEEDDVTPQSKQFAIAALRVANLDEIATQTADRNLISLQNLVASAGTWWIRISSLFAAGLLTFLAGVALGETLNSTYLVVGFAGGLIAIMLRDTFAAVAQRIAR